MRRPVRWLLAGIGVGAGIIAIAVAGVFALSGRKLARVYTVPVHAPALLPDDSAALAEGRRLAHAFACAECHEADFGGRVLIDAPPMGTLAAPNLTSGRGGLPSDYSIEDWARAVRHGIGGNGRGLMLMPSAEFSRMSDGHLARIVAYVRSVSPVDRELPERKVGPVARMLVLTGGPFFQPELIDHERGDYTAPPRGATVAYGAYLGYTCAGCHGPGMAGGVTLDPQAPLTANLTPHPDGLGDWSLDDFRTALRDGVRPDGRELDPAMPRSFGHFADDEIEALWLYVGSLPPRPSDWAER